jgi:hypothetical protein
MKENQTHVVIGDIVMELLNETRSFTPEIVLQKLETALDASKDSQHSHALNHAMAQVKAKLVPAEQIIPDESNLTGS